MMGRNVVETMMGALVIFVAIGFIMISYKSGNIAPASDSYKIISKFHEVGSLSIGSDVRIGGIKIGSISAQYLDPKTYMAVLEFSINKSIKLPKDTSAAIVGDGLLGGKYVSLQPGGDDNLLKGGDEIKYTQDSISIEQLIGKFAFGGVNKDGAKEADKAEPTEKK
jgi:phospholipid/cholesterol/gamma-HCH transport system substrate-binding protein